MKKTVRIILSAALAISMCTTLIVGSTFALFTSESSINIAVSSGKVEIVASVVDLQTASDITDAFADDAWVSATEADGVFTGEFANGGTATYTAATNNIALDNISPGDAAKFSVKIENNSTVAIKYYIQITTAEADDSLAQYLKFTADDKQIVLGADVQLYEKWIPLAAGVSPDGNVEVIIALPSTVTSEQAGDKSCNLTLQVVATQGNAPQVEKLDIHNETELKNTTEKINNGEIESAEITLCADIVLESTDWAPIGTVEHPFSGKFDGGGFTISNVKSSHVTSRIAANVDQVAGLFGSIAAGSEISNLVIESADIEVAGSNVGILAGHAVGATIKDIELTGKFTLRAQNNVGLLVGDFQGELSDINIAITEDSSITGNTNVGALVGVLGEGSTITGVHVNDEAIFKTGIGTGSTSTNWEENIEPLPKLQVSGYENVGGIVGKAESGVTISEVQLFAFVTLLSDSTEKNTTAPVSVGVICGVLDGTDSSLVNIKAYAVVVNKVWFGSEFEFGPQEGSRSYPMQRYMMKNNRTISCNAQNSEPTRSGIWILLFLDKTVQALVSR